MIRKIILLLCPALLTSLVVFAQTQTKKPLTHSVYDSWKTLVKTQVTDNGKYVSYEINPQKGDGFLHLENLENKQHDSIYRGQGAVFSSSSDLMVFRINQPEDTLRKLKLAKKKKDDMPKDSLGIWLLPKDTLLRFAGLKSFQLPKEGGSWVAWLYEKPKVNEKEKAKTDSLQKSVPDTLMAKPKEAPAAEKPKEKDKKKKKSAFADIETANLRLLNPLTNQKYDAENVTETAFAQNGKILAFISLRKDSIDAVAVNVFDTRSLQLQKIFTQPGFAKKITASADGKQVAFLFTPDTVKVKRFGLYLWDDKTQVTRLIADTSKNGIIAGWEVSENGNLNFSDDGSKLYFGTAPKKMPEPKDTLLEEEKVKLDIWSWNDARLQSQQLKNLDDDLKNNYLAVYRMADKRIVQLADTLLEQVRTYRKGNADFALGLTNKPYAILSSWEGATYRDVYLVDLKTGNRKLLLKKHPATAELSPSGKYLLYYADTDSSWNCLQLSTGKQYCLSRKVNVNFSDEENDQPDAPNPYGIAGWTKDDASVLIYDRYDIWLMNPENKTEAVRLTNGRESGTSFRYVKTTPDAFDINPKDTLLLKLVEDKSCKQGFAQLLLAEPQTQKTLILTDHDYNGLVKAKNAPLYLWQRSSYTECPELYAGTINFQDIKKLSVSNPQQNLYLWGTVEHVYWKSFDGGNMRGLLYKPENFDPAKKYPMIVYFYEKYSGQIHNYYMPAPSRSIVNFTFYNSNGYIVFVPDITYRIGEPGRSAYDDVISGTLAMTKLPYIDADRMGLQGQSWGGYQVAYLVTQTGLFKAAMAGAPVSNMTSAYGGIRWESGIVRESQYEHGQSRIGANLWENRDLYIENSPVFYANHITTPLLIMSNDNDGAVPYYQGIELITAMRRLGKPAWLLCYNGDEHNLVKRPNRQDLSIRMNQFFDHYLKGTPTPIWMEKGLPAVVKGKELRYDLPDEEQK